MSSRSSRRRPPPALLGLLVPGPVDQDTAHGLGGGGEEVAGGRASAGRFAGPDQPQVGLVHQGGRLQGLAGLLLRQPLGGKPAQLIVNQRQELIGRFWVALFDGREYVGDIAHWQAARDVTPGWGWSRTALARAPVPSAPEVNGISITSVRRQRKSQPLRAAGDDERVMLCRVGSAHRQRPFPVGGAHPTPYGRPCNVQRSL